MKLLKKIGKGIWYVAATVLGAVTGAGK